MLIGVRAINSDEFRPHTLEVRCEDLPWQPLNKKVPTYLINSKPLAILQNYEPQSFGIFFVNRNLFYKFVEASFSYRPVMRRKRVRMMTRVKPPTAAVTMTNTWP